MTLPSKQIEGQRLAVFDVALISSLPAARANTITGAVLADLCAKTAAPSRRSRRSASWGFRSQHRDWRARAAVARSCSSCRFQLRKGRLSRQRPHAFARPRFGGALTLTGVRPMLISVRRAVAPGEKEMAKGFSGRLFAGQILRKGTFLGKSMKSVAASDLSQAAKRDKVSKALSSGSKKAGTFETRDARKRG